MGRNCMNMHVIMRAKLWPLLCITRSIWASCPRYGNNSWWWQPRPTPYSTGPQLPLVQVQAETRRSGPYLSLGTLQTPHEPFQMASAPRRWPRNCPNLVFMPWLTVIRDEAASLQPCILLARESVKMWLRASMHCVKIWLRDSLCHQLVRVHISGMCVQERVSMRIRVDTCHRVTTKRQRQVYKWWRRFSVLWCAPFFIPIPFKSQTRTFNGNGRTIRSYSCIIRVVHWVKV